MIEFSNSQVLISELPDWQDVQFVKISSKYRSVLLFRYSLILIIFLLVFFSFFILNEASWDNNYQLALGVGLVFIVVLFVLNIWSIRYWGYAVREYDILYCSGFLTKMVKIIPFRHVQHVDIKEGVLSRIFGLSSIELHTAGAGEGLKIRGIESAKVTNLQEYISRKISIVSLDSSYE